MGCKFLKFEFEFEFEFKIKFEFEFEFKIEFEISSLKCVYGLGGLISKRLNSLKTHKKKLFQVFVAVKA